MPPKRRGPYKNYLKDPDVPIPRGTTWSRQKALDDQDQHNPVEENAEAYEGGSSDIADDGSASSSSSTCGSDIDEPMDVQSDSSVSPSSSSSQGTNSDFSIQSERRDIDNAIDSDTDEAMSGEGDAQADSDTDLDRDERNFNINCEGINRQQLPANLFEEKREPLYPGARITSDESDVLIKTFLVRWNLEENAVEHLLKVIDCHMPTSLLASQFCFLKKFPVGPSKKLRYFCPSCSHLLPADLQDNFDCECGYVCTLKELRHDGRMFVQMSLAEQIKHIMAKEDIVRHMRKECEESDVISGKLYRRFRETGVIGNNDISLQFNRDGVSPCKTSKVSMYPIHACINELPYDIRKDNMMLCGLYYGKKKPDLNEFLKPFVEELKLLNEVGVNCDLPGREEPVNVKVHTILCSVDSVARAPLQGIMAHNGRHGCSFCLRRGRRMKRGKGYARFYVGGLVGLPRNANQHIQALESLQDYNDTHRKKKKHIQGVTRESILLSLPGFNIVKSFVPDYMHLVLEGVVKTVWSHWTSSEYNNEPWYLSKSKREHLSEKLMIIRPPIEVTRVPRSLDEMSYWRAHEIKSFLLYYSLVCLKGILPIKYLRHWLLLVYSMTVFLKEKIVREEFLKGSLALQKFVQDIAILYPQCYSMYTFNTHMLLHIPKAVENFGGLWASSTFPFENSNGVLSRFIRGSQGIPMQICTSFLRLRHVHDVGCDVFTKSNSSEVGKELFNSMLGKFHVTRRTYQCGEGLRYFGGPHNYTLSLIEKASLQELLNKDVEVNALSYCRLLLKGKVFHAESSGALRVRENSYARLLDGSLVVISAILLIKVSNSNEVVSVCVCKRLQNVDEILCQDADIGVSSSSIMYTCHRGERIVSIMPRSIDLKCVGIPHGDAICLIPLANTIERD